jgi:class 3 adenylate cyclase
VTFDSEANAKGHYMTEDRGAREAFLASKRHELRTPINAIIGYSEMLLEDAEDAEDRDRVSDLKKILQAGRSLLRKVNDFLDPEVFESGDIDLSDMEAFGERIHLELRNDTNTVIGYSEMLIDEAGSDEEESVSDLSRIRDSATQIVELIGEIIGSAEVMSGAVDFDAASHSVSKIEGAAATLQHLDAPGVESDPGRILVVDDNEMNRDILTRRLKRQGHTVGLASNGREALDQLHEEQFDLVLLDILMPELDGFQVLERMKADQKLRNVPVIVLSALDNLESIVRCIEMGADDYVSKPFHAVVLRARVSASLEKKRLRDREQEYLRELAIEREKSESLLLNVLPAPIAERLKRGERTIADQFTEVTILFSDVVGFTAMSSRITPAQLVDRLGDIFQRFDAVAADCGVEKIKTIGDAYFAVAGVPEAKSDHAERVVELALGMRRALRRYNSRADDSLEIRIGINTGPVVAGVIGTAKFAYDLWGDAVNVASRMESTGVPGRIQVSPSTYAKLREKYEFESRGEIEVKGKGKMQTYLLVE